MRKSTIYLFVLALAVAMIGAIGSARFVASAQNSNSSMTNMNMATDQIRVEPLGQGNYMAQFHLYMSGPWEISIGAHADGFEPIAQTLFVQVE